VGGGADLAAFEVESALLEIVPVPMFHVILFQPEIPPNTGNVIRLCANTGAQLHLIRPLGFELDDKQLKRAGLDYHEYATLKVHDDLAACLRTLPDARVFAFTTKGSQPYHSVSFQPGDAFLFGPESRGLPEEVRASLPPEQRLRLPMLPDNRSLNLSNTVAIAVYEAWRQCEFANAA
jgi:tRNA (cytidine/uridine-2'-O-)-methyltransferase